MNDALKEKNKSIGFHTEGKKDMTKMYEKVIEIFEKSIPAFTTEDISGFGEINKLEDVIDQMKIDCQEGHVKRMAEGKCSIESGLIFTDLVIGYERIADHAVNIAYSISVSYTHLDVYKRQYEKNTRGSDSSSRISSGRITCRNQRK